jgi:hypothetical protein
MKFANCRTRSYAVVCWLTGCCWLAAIIGCHDESARLPVAGGVTLDGRALKEGQISFSPLPGTGGPTAGAPIVDGKYSIEADRGPMAGQFRVEITAMEPAAEKTEVFNVATGKTELTEQYKSIIPPRYNVNSELVVELPAEDSRRDFTLLSE